MMPLYGKPLPIFSKRQEQLEQAQREIEAWNEQNPEIASYIRLPWWKKIIVKVKAARISFRCPWIV